LESRLDGTRSHGFLREEIGRADQNAELGASPCERRGERGDHRGGEGVMDSAREDHMEVLEIAGRDGVQQDVDHGLPEDEARPGPDVPAALPSFEDEAPGAVREKHLEEPWRRDVEIGGDPVLLQIVSLIRAASGDQREGRSHVANHRKLFPAQLERDEAEDPDPPRAIAETFPGLLEKPLDLGRAHQRQGQKGEGAPGRHRFREGGNVAHAGHGPLEDRIPGPVGLCEGRSGIEGTQPSRGIEMFGDGAADRLEEAAHRAVPAGEGGGEGGVLAHEPGAPLGIGGA
jgi:hypothetical protein